jgi:hypothetical protein
MARSKLVMTVLGAAAVLAVAGCGSVTAADAGSAGAASSPARSPASATTSPAGGGTAAPSPGQVNGTGAALGGASGPLCSAPGAPSQVIITRTGVGTFLPAGARISAFLTSATPPSPGLVIKGAVQARALAKALCGLPAMAGVVHCPLEGSVSYRLAFLVGGRLLPAVIVRSSGCETVTGAGPVRSAAGNSAFLKLLASIAGRVPLPGAVHLPGAVSGGPLRPLATALG